MMAVRRQVMAVKVQSTVDNRLLRIHVQIETMHTCTSTRDAAKFGFRLLGFTESPCSVHPIDQIPVLQAQNELGMNQSSHKSITVARCPSRRAERTTNITI